jgi:hypothetical protein
MQVYLPATVPLLARWWAAQAADVTGTAYAVTPALREWYRDADADELDYAAQLAAGRASIELLAHDLGAPRRRVVVSADVADSGGVPRPQVHRAAVSLAGPVRVEQWVCALADDASGEVAVATAVADLARAAVGDEDARFALDEADAHELGWYAVQEIPQLIG